MQNFQQILTQAAQLKQHQLKKDRKGYQSLPQFLKSGLGYNKKYDLIRKQHFLYQYRISNKVKQEGNTLFKQDKIAQALNKYEQALSIFRFIQSKSYENMKDEDLSYHNYNPAQLRPELREMFENHLCAIYLNICSCLTKLNKKQDAIYSADQALKIKKTPKGHYKKAQAYIKYVNKQANDIKLGLLQLKQAYSLSKDESILKQMHNVKQNYEKDQQKSKNWFKFMFNKNKQSKNEQEIKPETKKSQIKSQKQLNPQNMSTKIQQLEQQMQNSQKFSENEKMEQTQIKEKLKHFLALSDGQWEYCYQKQFIRLQGSKIYSILKIYKCEDLASQYRAKLAKCLESQDSKQKNINACKQWVQWLKNHPMEKIKKYIQRYDLQTSWIKQNRMKKQGVAQKQESKSQCGNACQFTQTGEKDKHKQNIDQTLINQKDNFKKQLNQNQIEVLQNQHIQSRRKQKKSANLNSLRRQLQNHYQEQEKKQNQQKMRKSREIRIKWAAAAIALIVLLIRFLIS